MKEKDILSSFKDQQLIYYAEKDDEAIGPVLTASYMAENYLDEFYKIWSKLEKSLLDKLMNREISPIARFMALEELTPQELSSRAGLPRGKVKKHLLHKHFLKATVAELHAYAEVFNIPVANLFQVIETKEDGQWNMGFNQEEAESRPLTISQKKSSNPLVVCTEPEHTPS